MNDCKWEFVWLTAILVKAKTCWLTMMGPRTRGLAWAVVYGPSCWPIYLSLFETEICYIVVFQLRYFRQILVDCCSLLLFMCEVFCIQIYVLLCMYVVNSCDWRKGVHLGPSSQNRPVCWVHLQAAVGRPWISSTIWPWSVPRGNVVHHNVNVNEKFVNVIFTKYQNCHVLAARLHSRLK